jgi:hypothetical protein
LKPFATTAFAALLGYAAAQVREGVVTADEMYDLLVRDPKSVAREYLVRNRQATIPPFRLCDTTLQTVRERLGEMQDAPRETICHVLSNNCGLHVHVTEPQRRLRVVLPSGDSVCQWYVMAELASALQAVPVGLNLGFGEGDSRDMAWCKNLLRLEEHLRSSGGVYPPKNGESGLGVWVDNQRNGMRRGKEFLLHRRELLEGLQEQGLWQAAKGERGRPRKRGRRDADSPI